MQPLNMTLVAGPPGAGKTTWIRQLNGIESAAYLNLGAGATPIDATYLAAEVPGLTILSDQQLLEFLKYSIAGDAYIELGFYLDLASLVLPIEVAHC